MDPVFSIGISSLWDELRHMPAGASGGLTSIAMKMLSVWRIKQLHPKAETAHVAVISMDSDPAKIFQLDDSQGPEK